MNSIKISISFENLSKSRLCFYESRTYKSAIVAAVLLLFLSSTKLIEANNSQGDAGKNRMKSNTPKHFNTSIVSKLISRAPSRNDLQLTSIDDSDVSFCLKHQGTLSVQLSSLRLDSMRWNITSWLGNASSSCKLSLTASEDSMVHVAQWRHGHQAKCSEQNFVMLRDHGYSFKTTDCGGQNMSLYKSSTNTVEIVIVVGELGALFSTTIVVQAMDSTFTVEHITSKIGYIQTPYHESEQSSSPAADSWITISPPLNHPALISIRTLLIRWRRSDDFQMGSVRLYNGGRSAKNMVWKASANRKVPSAQVYSTRLMYLRFSGKPSYLWVKLLYSFHEQCRQPSRANSHLWNCSVVEWPEFQRHFWCNLERECEGGEDEAGCVYSGPCGQDNLTLGDRCYAFVQGRDMSWRDSNLECQRRGGYLASFNTLTEAKAVGNALSMRRSNRKVFVGLQKTSSLMPAMYKDSNMWADETVAYLASVIVGFKNHCGYVYSVDIYVLAMCDKDEKSVEFVCELHSLSEQVLRSTNNAESDSQSHIHFPQNASFGTPTVQCPSGHFTHDFLACDEQSWCWPSRYRYAKSRQTWPDFPSRASCSAPLTSLPAMFNCGSGQQRVPYSLVCDHRQHCGDRSDESFCVFPPCSGSTPLQCTTSKQCLSLSALCNRHEDCRNSDDEALCTSNTNFKLILPPGVVYFNSHLSTSKRYAPYYIKPFMSVCPNTHFQCPNNGYCLPVFVRCNDVNDCPGREDEVGCTSLSCPGLYRCRSSRVCLHPSQVCDRFSQCPQQDDELLCEQICPAGCTCLGLDFTCRQPFPTVTYAEVRFIDASGSGLTLAHLRQNKMLIHLSLSWCKLKIIHTLTSPNLRSLDLSHNDLYAVSTHHLRGMSNLQYLSLANNPLEVLFPLDTDQYTFPVMNTLDMSGIKIEKLNIHIFLFFPDLQMLNLSDCDVDHVTSGFQTASKLRILDITGCPMTQFPRDFISDLSQLQSIRADNFKICCAATLPAAFNLANCKAPFDEVSSCDSLLRTDIFIVFLSVFSGLSLLGNLGCFLKRCVRSKGNTSGFGVFVTFLCVSDFLMGVYLAIIGVADRLYKGSYLWEDISWRQSVPCSVAGFLSLLSSEVSAFIICLITLDRFLVLRFPFSSLHFKARSAYLACAVIWLVVMAIAAIPFTPMASHWSFYSQTGICIPLPVTRRDFPGRHYAFGVLIVCNFILFLLIAIGQAAIYISVRANSLSTTDSTKKSNDLRIARRLISVAVSDFLCWFPIGLLGLLASKRFPIPGEVNVGMAILVLPLNSAINPFLYTINIMLERRRRSENEKLIKQLTAELCQIK